MKGKIAFVLGAAVGYVLGARAGRKRYEQIKAGAEKVWNTAPVQAGADQVKGFINAQGAAAGSVAGDTLRHLVSLIVDRITTPRPAGNRADVAETSPGAPYSTSPESSGDRAARTTASPAESSSAAAGAARPAAGAPYSSAPEPEHTHPVGIPGEATHAGSEGPDSATAESAPSDGSVADATAKPAAKKSATKKTGPRAGGPKPSGPKKGGPASGGTKPAEGKDKK